MHQAICITTVRLPAFAELLNCFDTQVGSRNIHYVQQRVREHRLSRSNQAVLISAPPTLQSTA